MHYKLEDNINITIDNINQLPTDKLIEVLDCNINDIKNINLSNNIKELCVREYDNSSKIRLPNSLKCVFFDIKEDSADDIILPKLIEGLIELKIQSSNPKRINFINNQLPNSLRILNLYKIECTASEIIDQIDIFESVDNYINLSNDLFYHDSNLWDNIKYVRKNILLNYIMGNDDDEYIIYYLSNFKFDIPYYQIRNDIIRLKQQKVKSARK